jgi:hypothetical protein
MRDCCSVNALKKRWLLAALILISSPAFACELEDRKKCRELVRELIGLRTEAIQNAFGDAFAHLPQEIEIRFVAPRDEQYRRYSGRIAYDAGERVLVIPHKYLHAKLPRPLDWAKAYWPYYEKGLFRQHFPLIEAIDNALWGAHLQEAARERGLRWPHRECDSLHLSERLPCEMVVRGIAMYLTQPKSTVFNVNRLDRIWPEDFAEFERRVYRKGEREYLDVQHYGGILLLEPLIGEFGIPRALAYVAKNPFLLHDGNLRASALRYQEDARETLSWRAANARVALQAETIDDKSVRPEPILGTARGEAE